MAYKVIAECLDTRTADRRFFPGDIFDPEPDEDQAVRLVKAGCIKLIADADSAKPGRKSAKAADTALTIKAEPVDTSATGEAPASAGEALQPASGEASPATGETPPRAV